MNTARKEPLNPADLRHLIQEHLQKSFRELPADLAARFARQSMDMGVAMQWDAMSIKERDAVAKGIDEWSVEHASVTRLAAEKRVAGRYTPDEAAQVLETTGERREAILKKLLAAAENSALPVFLPGENARHEYPPGQRAWSFREEAFWDDLNRWLDANEPRIRYRFPDPQRGPGAHSGLPERPVALGFPVSADRGSTVGLGPNLKIGRNAVAAVQAFVDQQARILYRRGDTMRALAERILAAVPNGCEGERTPLTVASIERRVPAGITGGRSKNGGK